MAEHMLSDPIVVPRSLPPQLERGGLPNEMYSYPGSMTASEADADWMEEEDWLLKGDQQGRRPRYGSDEQREIHRDRLSRTKPGRRRQRLKSTTVSSLTRIFSREDNDDSSDEEEPPLTKMIYRRSRKDVAKLIMLPSLYFVLMVLAFVFAFYTIEGLLESYNNRVRSVQIIDVQDRYDPIGIAIMPQFSEYQSCGYRYYDDVSPHPQKPPSHCDKYEIPTEYKCINYNITFNSTSLRNVERHAMVFQGPTLVACKESIAIRFLINATEREFSAVEYMLFENWYYFEQLDDEGKKDFLANKESTTSIYTFPAGFRTWVKMSYSVRYDMGMKTNVTDFTIIDNYGSYNDPGMGNQFDIFPMEVLFEWKSNQYEYIKEIISTTAWSAFGSLCGVFITLVKAGEFGHAWVRRIRRDRQKKIVHLKQLEEEQKKLMEAYEERQRERRETKLRKSLEATQPNIVRPIN